MKKIQNFINGKLVDPASEKWLDNYNPSTGEIYSFIPDSDERDVEEAVLAARAAFPGWSRLSAEKRASYLISISDMIKNRIEELALAETIDNGKPLWLSRSVDIPRAAQNMHFYATAFIHDEASVHQTSDSILNYTHRSPIGIAGCISPWNLPLYLFTWKIAPALASGNCVIAKPSEVTPMTAFLFSEICKDIGLPPGVLNVVHGTGPGAGSSIVGHPEIKAISFTGGTSTGKHIASIAAPMFKKLSLELGGKNPNIIFADCDFELCLETTIKSSFQNQGEICLCGSRIFIERPIYEKFRDALVKKTKSLMIGDPLIEDNRVGAIVSKAHYEKILSYIELSKKEGGKVLTGGNTLHPEGRCQNGWFIEPTIIEGLGNECRTNQEEIFGPVVSLIPFDSEEEALEMANSTPYGLAGTIWTQNLSRAHRVAHKLESGIIWINCWLVRDLRTPFGGMKQSGVGREGGFEALHFFTEEKNICIKL